MADLKSKILYIVVTDGEKDKGSSFRYTRSVLQSTLQVMGCKARHAFKISRKVFDAVKNENIDNRLETSDTLGKRCDLYSDKEGSTVTVDSAKFELYKRMTTVFLARETFLTLVCDALSAYKYVGLDQKADLILACRIRERKESMTVLLCGTSGCGKSTLSSLLGSRLGITTVISTDSIRHMMRSYVDEKQNPLLWASTYHAGEYLDPIAVSEAKAKRKAKKVVGTSNGKADSQMQEKLNVELVGKKQMAIEGYKAQSEMVIESLDRLITAWEERKESVIVEGVHLSLNFVMGLMKKHPSIIPFMIYIQDEGKHMERFAVRAKYMTLDPAKNKYIKYMRNIRTIQEYLCKRADKHLVPKVNNTNVDRSIAAIHATLFSCLRRRYLGDKLHDPVTKTVPIIYEEYRNQCAANSLSSKGMFQLIQRQGSSRHLMAIVNTDGTVAKAWPVKSEDGNGPMYGPLDIGKAEPVNLQFGNFGISAWRSENGGTSSNSIDDFFADGNGNASRYSSSCNSPRISEGTAKEPMEDGLSLSGSEEDQMDDPPEIDSDEDQSDAENENMHEEEEGSVDEESTKSDEEYDDLAMRDDQDNGYSSNDENGSSSTVNPTNEESKLGHSKE